MQFNVTVVELCIYNSQSSLLNRKQKTEVETVTTKTPEQSVLLSSEDAAALFQQVGSFLRPDPGFSTRLRPGRVKDDWFRSCIESHVTRGFPLRDDEKKFRETVDVQIPGRICRANNWGKDTQGNIRDGILRQSTAGRQTAGVLGRWDSPCGRMSCLRRPVRRVFVSLNAAPGREWGQS